MRDAVERWYAQGLRFGCTGCHACCRGSHEGVIYATKAEIFRIAQSLGLSVFRFRALYVKEVRGFDTLRLLPNGDCSLWNDGCTVYPQRPRQCRTYPFWPEFLKTRTAWENEARACEGMNEGELHSLEVIRDVLRSRR